MPDSTLLHWIPLYSHTLLSIYMLNFPGCGGSLCVLNDNTPNNATIFKTKLVIRLIIIVMMIIVIL